MKEQYIKEIINLLHQCEDLSFLDFLYQLLKKELTETA